MNILYLNTTYLCGGAEKVTNQIMAGMEKRGHTVYEIVSYHRQPCALPGNVKVLYHGAPLLILNRLLTENHGNKSLTIPYSRNAILRFIRQKKIDVVHLNNAHGNFLGIRDIRAIAEACPVVWTLHDFWALTGHCTSPTDCPDKWKNGCERCGQLQNYPPLKKDISHRLWEEKRAAFRGLNIHFVTPSEWMAEQARASHLAGESCRAIHNSLDTDLWKVYPKKELRRQYGLPETLRTLAFVAADPQKKQKGMHLLLEALKRLPDPQNYLLLIAGQEGGLSTIEDMGFSCRHFGYIAGQKAMNEFYSLADLLVNPSLYDTFGLVNIEAMASGTPAIVFPICAMEEIVTPDSGWLCGAAASQSLSESIEAAFSDPEALAQKSNASRERAVSVFSEPRMLDAYEEEYRNCICSHMGSR